MDTSKIHFEKVDIDLVQYAECNPKNHDLQAIAESEQRYGFIELPIISESSHRLVVGQGRIDALRALKANGKEPPEGVTVIEGKWFIDVRFFPFKSDAEAQAYLFDSNNIGMMGGDFTPFDIAKQWDEAAYLESLKSLAEQGALPVSVTGEDMDAILESMNGGGGESGNLLGLVDVTIQDPKHSPESGEVWQIGNHLLIVADVFSDWGLWKDHLQEGDLFVPFPGPFVPLTLKAEKHRLVMVQPDTYVAGHMVDQWVNIHGEETVQRLSND